MASKAGDDRTPMDLRVQWMAEEMFAVQIKGLMRAVSQFGIPYTYYANGYIRAEGLPFPEVEYDDEAVEITRALFASEIAKGNDVIVWRRLPEEDLVDAKRRLSFRAHFMPRSMIALAWESPGLSEKVFREIAGGGR